MLRRSLQHLLIALLALTITIATTHAQTSLPPQAPFAPPPTQPGVSQPPPATTPMPNTWQIWQAYCDTAGNLHVEYRGPGGVVHVQTYQGGCRANATTGTDVGGVVNQAHASCDINRGSITITADLVRQASGSGGVMVSGYHIKCTMLASGDYQCTISASQNGAVLEIFTWGGNAFTWAYACRSAIVEIIEGTKEVGGNIREFCIEHDLQFTVGSDGEGGVTLCFGLRY